MLNQIVLVGRLTKDLEVLKGENDKKYARITLAITRSYKNSEGVYDTDFVDCIIFDHIAENVAHYCKKGDIVGVKGRIATDINDDKEKTTSIIAEKVTFLSARSQNQKEDNEQER